MDELIFRQHKSQRSIRNKNLQSPFDKNINFDLDRGTSDEFKAVRKKLQIARVDLEYCAVAFCKFLEANIDVLEDVPADAPEDAPEDSLEVLNLAGQTTFWQSLFIYWKVFYQQWGLCE